MKNTGSDVFLVKCILNNHMYTYISVHVGLEQQLQ